MGRQALVPNYARLARLQGHEVLVWGVSHPAGRQIAHAMRQFGAHVWCGDCDRAAAGEVAYEVGGDVLVREPLCGTWPRGAE
ncbi:MAG: hypothetical protein KIS89_09420, partial [Dokdonella sp.]|nr:hypothetical protein [Dokdonella sp.]